MCAPSNECIVPQGVMTGRLRPGDGDDNNLFVACLLGDLIDEEAFELEVLTVNQLECLFLLHRDSRHQLKIFNRRLTIVCKFILWLWVRWLTKLVKCLVHLQFAFHFFLNHLLD